MKLPVMNLAYRYCLGKGIELGASAHNPFDLPDCEYMSPSDGVSYLYKKDLDDHAFYMNDHAQYTEETLPITLIGDFQEMRLADASKEYVISSHVLEHSPNVIAAFVETDRVLVNGGIFFTIVPKRTALDEDGVRALTTLEEWVDSFERNVTMADMPLDTWRSHYQVFSLQSLIRLVNYINRRGLGHWLIECVEETDSKVGNGHTIVLRKMENLGEFIGMSDQDISAIIVAQINEKNYESALYLTKAFLSFEFFNAEKLFIAALLNLELGHAMEGLNFLIQALIQNPENVQYRTEYKKLTGVNFQNPVQ